MPKDENNSYEKKHSLFIGSIPPKEDTDCSEQSAGSQDNNNSTQGQDDQQSEE